MDVDVRESVARYYDLGGAPEDLEFYRRRVPFPDASVLDLGCGTGRILVPLNSSCGYIEGVDASEAMLAICRGKLEDGKAGSHKAQVQLGDITNLNLGSQFDLVIAPFRVMQNLETDEEVDGLFDSIRRHLKPEGSCILNVFNPKADKETMCREWCSDSERFAWEAPYGSHTVRVHDRRLAMDRERMVLYPELIWREYDGDHLVDEARLQICMRVYYPDEFVRLVASHGFKVVDRWGGYAGEPYGEGPELVAEFVADAEPVH